jgi:hypothetical protein
MESTIHSSPVSPACRSRPTVGSATLTTVVETTARNRPGDTTARASQELRHSWIAQGVVPKWAPHSWLAGTLPGLPVRCCMMIGVNSW